MFKPIMRISRQPEFRYLRWRYIAGLFSLIVIGASLLSVAVQGFNLGIDFRGGTQIEIRSPRPINFNDLRSRLSGAITGELSLQQGDTEYDVLIRIEEQTAGEADAVAKIKEILGNDIEIRRVESIGPKVTSELMMNAIIAIVVASLGIGLYIGVRFEWQYSVGALVALLHDVIVVLGMYSIFRLEFDLTSVAAVLTVAGYSVNDTVVIFDRVRELTRKYKAMNYEELVDLAINQTLMRTLATSGSTLVAILPLLIWGGDVLFGLSLALFVGVLTGSYSTVYIATASLLYLTPRGRAKSALPA
jgi:preprotein translocase subunit SecF